MQEIGARCNALGSISVSSCVAMRGTALQYVALCCHESACCNALHWVRTRCAILRLWLQRGVLIVKWTVLAGLGFFAVLILERLAVML